MLRARVALIWFAPHLWAGCEEDVARVFSWMVPWTQGRWGVPRGSCLRGCVPMRRVRPAPRSKDSFQS